jgi:hypothetical protein
VGLSGGGEDVNVDMACTVGHEHTRAPGNGEPRTYSLPVTQRYRCENGQWKVVHRHPDTLLSEMGDGVGR